METIGAPRNHAAEDNHCLACCVPAAKHVYGFQGIKDEIPNPIFITVFFPGLSDIEADVYRTCDGRVTVKLLELTRSYYPSVGGLEKHVLERGRVYDALGITYDIIATTFSTEKRDDTIDINHIRRLRQFTPYNITPALPLYLSDEYDCISVNHLGRFYSDFAIHRYRNRRQKIFVTPYFAYHTNRFQLLKKAVEKYWFPKLIDNVDALIVLSNHEKAFWSDVYSVDENNIFVIPPYVETGKKEPQNISEIAGEKYFFYLGRAGGNKRTDLLLEAFASLRNIDTHLLLTIRLEDVGTDLLPIVARDKRIRFLGYVNEADKMKLMMGAEALIFPTTWESFGYVAFEASGLNKPLLCSDIPILRELLDPGGVLFFQNDVHHLTGAINEFLGYSTEKKNEMGAANYRNLAKYSFEVACAKYKAMFASIMGM